MTRGEFFGADRRLGAAAAVGIAFDGEDRQHLLGEQAVAAGFAERLEEVDGEAAEARVGRGWAR